MLRWFRRKNPVGQAAQRLYEACVRQARNPFFYKECAVPDTLDGRYELVCLHVFLVVDRLGGEPGKPDPLAQALFDAMCRDFSASLREIGIGDMGLPRHMRRMMTGFNGRAHAYSRALADGAEILALEDALMRNIYGSVPDVPDLAMRRFLRYVNKALEGLAQKSAVEIREGRAVFISPEQCEEEEEEEEEEESAQAKKSTA